MTNDEIPNDWLVPTLRVGTLLRRSAISEPVRHGGYAEFAKTDSGRGEPVKILEPRP